jgi:hypothetical protein
MKEHNYNKNNQTGSRDSEIKLIKRRAKCTSMTIKKRRQIRTQNRNYINILKQNQLDSTCSQNAKRQASQPLKMTNDMD